MCEAVHAVLFGLFRLVRCVVLRLSDKSDVKKTLFSMYMYSHIPVMLAVCKNWIVRNSNFTAGIDIWFKLLIVLFIFVLYKRHVTESVSINDTHESYRRNSEKKKTNKNLSSNLILQ